MRVDLCTDRADTEYKCSASTASAGCSLRNIIRWEKITWWALGEVRLHLIGIEGVNDIGGTISFIFIVQNYLSVRIHMHSRGLGSMHTHLCQPGHGEMIRMRYVSAQATSVFNAHIDSLERMVVTPQMYHERLLSSTQVAGRWMRLRYSRDHAFVRPLAYLLDKLSGLPEANDSMHIFFRCAANSAVLWSHQGLP